MFRKQTFWDVDLDTSNLEENRGSVIFRVLHKGGDKEFFYLNSIVDPIEIYSVLQKRKDTNPIILSFYKTWADRVVC